MSGVGQVEKATQGRVLRLLVDRLGYKYAGNWATRANNTNIEDAQLRAYLASTGIDPSLITRAVAELHAKADDTSRPLYFRNRDVYELLRYGVKVKSDIGDQYETVWLINWDQPEANHFAVAEEVTLTPSDPKANVKRPDLVVYVNGIAVAVIELKRSTVSVAAAIRQNLDNQKKEFIEGFFSTMQWIVAGNDTEGLRYGTIQTPEKYYLEWKEPADGYANPLDRAVVQLFDKPRLLELLHDFVVFDAGVKKLCRPNQYFAVKAAQPKAVAHEGGIIWHTQGSGKSLTMVWLAKWIHDNIPGSRVLILTDRDELDAQIAAVFAGVDEEIHRATSGADLVKELNSDSNWLLCSLIHKFGGKTGTGDVEAYVNDLRANLPKDFRAKGDIFVFVDEAHRTQSGELHKAMKDLLPDATLIGFTGTPLLRSDKFRSIEVFGPYIHTYKYDEAVRDGVVLDLRYEARDVDQHITSQTKIDTWFDTKTKGLNAVAKAQLRKRWGTLQKVLSSKSRLAVIVEDILMDMNTRDRLVSGHGNALLVAGSIYEACKYYELFNATELKGKVAIVTSYEPSIADIKGEAVGDGDTEALEKYAVYRSMLADWFNLPEDKAVTMVAKFEEQAKARFVNDPGQLKLLIVVDKLLTGFDAPPATYLYIDKEMRDHGLFQAICRVNRLDGDKEYGYVVDYKDLFASLEGAVKDYTSGAFDAYDPADVAGLLKERLQTAKRRLDDAREQVKALCEPVKPPKDTLAYLAYFLTPEGADADATNAAEKKRLTLYRLTSTFVRAYADLANEMTEAGYTPQQAKEIKAEVAHYEAARQEVKLASGDAPDLKAYEPGMRHLIDTYIKSEDSTKMSEFDDLTFLDLFVENPDEAIHKLPPGLKDHVAGKAAVIENNIRKVIVEESPVNPKYYEKMSKLLADLIAQRRAAAIEYREYLDKVRQLAEQVKNPSQSGTYPETVDTAGKRAIYDNFIPDDRLVILIDLAVHHSAQDGWRDSLPKRRRLTSTLRTTLGSAGNPVAEDQLETLIELLAKQDEY